MDIVISPTSDAPLYQQIFDQVSAQIIKGQLPSGFCLPPIRTIAKELRISVITIKRAWEELERAGFIYTMVGKGCFVALLSPETLQGKRSLLANEKLSKDIEYYKSLGLTLAEIVALVKRNFEE
ncbi:MAG: GntR family transcriptional regulator [Chloroflexota bacterium]